MAMEQARFAMMVAAALTATTFTARAQDGDVASGRAFARENLQLLPRRRINRCIASNRRHWPELSRHCKHQGDDGDGYAGFPDDFAPKDAKPDPHTRSDSRCERLYPELTRASLTRWILLSLGGTYGSV